MARFPEDFYGAMLRIVVLGYLRPEKNFNSVGELLVLTHSAPKKLVQPVGNVLCVLRKLLFDNIIGFDKRIKRKDVFRRHPKTQQLPISLNMRFHFLLLNT